MLCSICSIKYEEHNRFFLLCAFSVRNGSNRIQLLDTGCDLEIPKTALPARSLCYATQTSFMLTWKRNGQEHLWRSSRAASKPVLKHKITALTENVLRTLLSPGQWSKRSEVETMFSLAYCKASPSNRHWCQMFDSWSGSAPKLAQQSGKPILLYYRLNSKLGTQTLENDENKPDSWHNHLAYNCITDLSTNIVKVNIHTTWAEFTELLCHIPFLVIDSSIKPHFWDQNGALFICASNTHNSRAPVQTANLLLEQNNKEKLIVFPMHKH